MESIEEHRRKLNEIADYAFSHGVRSIGIDAFKVPPTNWNKELKNRFMIACHDGFKLAQKHLVAEVLMYQEILRTSNAELKEYRRQREKERIAKKTIEIKILEQRLHNLTHIADGIAWQLIHGQIHIARRFHIGERNTKFLDSSNLKHALTVVDAINENPEDFALISDLTGFVQIGDLLIKHKGVCGIMELKEGKVNDLIKEFFDKLEDEETELDEDELKKKYDQKTINQIKRVQRQKIRAARAIRVINTDEGKDPISGKNMVIGTPTVVTETFHKELHQLQQDLQQNIWAYTCIEKCLHIGMYRDEGIKMAGAAIHHILHHDSKNFVIIDWLSITRNLSEPIFAKPFSRELIIDILTGRVKIIMGLDVDELVRIFNYFGMKARWLSEKETVKAKQKAVREGLFEVNKKGIVVEFPETSITIYGGTVSKILYDCIRPSNVALSFLSIAEKSADLKNRKS